MSDIPTTEDLASESGPGSPASEFLPVWEGHENVEDIEPYALATPVDDGWSDQ